MPYANDTTELEEFPLVNIDEMTMDLLTDVRNTGSYIIDSASRTPYSLPLKTENGARCMIGTQ